MYTEHELILKEAASRYGVCLVRENTMGNSGNKVFEVKTAQDAYILKASIYSAQKEKHLAFELNWMFYLAEHLTGIVRPQKSINGNLFEIINIGEKTYLLSLFEKAPGKIVDPNNPDEFNETLFYHLGALMGEMHRLTIDYKGNIRTPAFEWTGAVNGWRYTNILQDEAVRLCQQKYYDAINTLPIDKESYGIIHWDIHTDNFFVDNGNIKIFDFEACQFN
ncbi:MAG: phosphotransferase enzyme family protein [Christensenellaceae bacterium]